MISKRPFREALGVIGGVALAVLFALTAYRSAGLRQAIVWCEPFAPWVLLVLGWALSARSSETPLQNGTDLRFVPGARGLLAGVAVILFLLPALRAWTKAETNQSQIAGFLPWSDASDYYLGAQHLLFTGRLDDWSARRPLNAALFAVRLALTGHDLRAALLLQGALLAIAAYLAARALALDLGSGAGVTFFAIFLGLGRYVAATTLSEALGLTLGALSFAALWHGLRSDEARLFAGGLTLLTLALCARSGPFLVLPCLALWAGIAFRGRHRFHARASALAIAAIAVGFVLNTSLLWRYGDTQNWRHANFPPVLYGLATGGKGWKQIESDHPEVRQMTGSAAMHFTYARAFEAIRSDPTRFLAGLGHGLSVFLRQLFNFMTFRPMAGGMTRAALAAALNGAGVVAFFRFLRLWGGDRATWMLLAALAGTLASVPVIYADGGVRVLIPMAPFAAAFGTILVLMLSPRGRLPPAELAVAHGLHASSWLTVMWGAALVVAAVLGPAAAIAVEDTHLWDPATCPDGLKALIVRVGSGSAFVEIEAADASVVATFAPSVRLRDFRKDPAFGGNEMAPLLGRIEGGTLLLNAYDLQRDHPPGQWAAGPKGMLGPSPTYLKLCGDLEMDPSTRRYSLFHVKSYEALPQQWHAAVGFGAKR